MFGEGVQWQEHWGGIVVDYDGGNVSLCSVQEALEQTAYVHVPLATCSALKVEFEIGIGLRILAHVIQSLGGKRRTAQVSVQDHARRVDYGSQRILQGARQPSLYGSFEAAQGKVKLRIVQLPCDDRLPQAV